MEAEAKWMHVGALLEEPERFAGDARAQAAWLMDEAEKALREALELLLGGADALREAHAVAHNPDRLARELGRVLGRALERARTASGAGPDRADRRVEFERAREAHRRAFETYNGRPVLRVELGQLVGSLLLVCRRQSLGSEARPRRVRLRRAPRRGPPSDDGLDPPELERRPRTALVVRV